MPKSQIGHLDASSMYNLVKLTRTEGFEKMHLNPTTKHTPISLSDEKDMRFHIPYAIPSSQILWVREEGKLFWKSTGAEVCYHVNVFVYISLLLSSSELFGFSYLLV